MDWLTASKIPVGDAAEAVVDWLKDNAAGLFDALSDGLDALIGWVLWLLQSPPPFVLIALFVALTWGLQRSWKKCVIVALGMLFILNQGYWKSTTETLSLILVACIVCMGIGVPLGILAARKRWIYTAMEPSYNFV